MVYEDETSNHFFGNVGSRTISEATQQQVDEEVRRILMSNTTVARNILENNKDIAHAMVKSTDGIGKRLIVSKFVTLWKVVNHNHLKVYIAENPVAAFEPPNDGPSHHHHYHLQLILKIKIKVAPSKWFLLHYFG